MPDVIPEMVYWAPWPRGPVEKIGPAGRCIYCGRKPPDVELTDEHVIADGLGGDLLYMDASCLECAKHTNRFETQVITGQFQWARGVVGVRSKKRKSPPLSSKVSYTEGGEEAELSLDGAPFMMAMPISETLPGILAGVRPEDQPTNYRLALFGDRDWHGRSLGWTGAPAQFRSGFKSHMGLLGQVIAKTAHAYACAKLSPDAFTPLLTDYILATEPAFDAHHMGIYSGHEQSEHLHFLALNVGKARQQTAVGMAVSSVYVVALRLFANKPTPVYLAVVGRPIGPVAAGVPSGLG